MTELVLAIDVTGSMRSDLNGNGPEGQIACRIAIVNERPRNSSTPLPLMPAAPWLSASSPGHFRVKFDQGRAHDGKISAGSEYPTRRYYPNPYWGSWENIGRGEDGNKNWFPDPHLETAAGEWHDLPNKPEAWQGCVDQRRMSGDNPPGISAVPPTPDEPFTMGFYSPTPAYPRDSPISYSVIRRTQSPIAPPGKKMSVL